MFKSHLPAIVALLLTGTTFAQQTGARSNSVDFSVALGGSQASFAGAYIHNWRLGAKQKFEVGIGGRMTAYFGSNQYYSTAPAKITTGGALFGDPIKANIDSLLIASAQIFSVNVMINLGYRFTEKFTVGFNIDAIGLSFGGENKGTYINGSQVQNAISNPTTFNALLIGDHDRGSLNSEFYGKYRLNDRWSVKAGLQHLFTEYTTVTKVQQFPEPNDRFRNKSTLFMIGVSMALK